MPESHNARDESSVAAYEAMSIAERRRRLTTEKARRKALMAPLQVMLSTTLAEISRYIDTGDMDILSSAVSCSHDADSERDRVKQAVGWLPHHGK